MKFAKELEQDLVPEWRIKYLNYKAGKKYVQAVARAIQRANTTPKVVGRRHDLLPPHEAPSFAGNAGAHQQEFKRTNTDGHEDGNLSESIPTTVGQALHSEPSHLAILDETRSLSNSTKNEANYGSFEPDSRTASGFTKTDSHQTFELPDPAMHLPSPPHGKLEQLREPFATMSSTSHSGHQRSKSAVSPPVDSFAKSRLKRVNPLRPISLPAPGRLQRLFIQPQQLERIESSTTAHSIQPIDIVRQREREFFDFLDSELDKVETFYRQKEVHAEKRLNALREQLHEMRNRRAYELSELRQRKHQKPDGSDFQWEKSGLTGRFDWISPMKSIIFKPGANSKALETMPQTPVVGAMPSDLRRDYARKSEHDVPYRTAKRKLKLALQEFYRGLELLKSYALLNRTAFRKLNKKYDKAVNARPPYRYMNEKVNNAWFVNSEAVDGHIRAVEDLYARYFEKGNGKVAAGKLRRVNRRPRDESSFAFWNGLSLGVGATFSVEGLVYASQLLFDPDPIIRLQTSYLLQIYGGYFLILLLFSLFCVNCYFWTAHKVNYPFIFEFDPQNHLDWRQLASFPSFFLLLFGIFFWLNFTRYGQDTLWLYYPVILIFVSLLIIFFPAPILWHKSRRWFAYSHFRLFFAGLYPVEFRDFFLGDIYCSLTYAVSNVELFFCLYAQYWKNPPLCNSSHSRILGFFSTLPAIWRALQCIRRYYDTKNVFPHLVNCGKYLMTILSYITLSLYRINNTHSNLALFITFSSVNGIYTSVWDLLMDFSLLQPDARHRYLRDILGLKRRWVYYVIMVIDPILRFSWIFYAIFTHSVQHSTLTSFLVSCSEVLRRGMWALLRVENEHCSNVAQYKASRDIPLPYDLPHEPLIEQTSIDEASQKTHEAFPTTDFGQVPAREQEAQDNQALPYQSATMEEGGLRRRRISQLSRAKSIRGIMANAHRQDFVKKRLPPEKSDSIEAASVDELHSEDEEEETEWTPEERLAHVETVERGETSENEHH
ncbi:EXS-domain-containing protein [Xylaria nigripes]|nr:EXS-domain-containing protein [Xylaria nigripes]